MLEANKLQLETKGVTVHDSEFIKHRKPYTRVASVVKCGRLID